MGQGRRLHKGQNSELRLEPKLAQVNPVREVKRIAVPGFCLLADFRNLQRPRAC